MGMPMAAYTRSRKTRSPMHRRSGEHPLRRIEGRIWQGPNGTREVRKGRRSEGEVNGQTAGCFPSERMAASHSGESPCIRAGIRPVAAAACVASSARRGQFTAHSGELPAWQVVSEGAIVVIVVVDVNNNFQACLGFVRQSLALCVLRAAKDCKKQQPRHLAAAGVVGWCLLTARACWQWAGGSGAQWDEDGAWLWVSLSV